MSPPSGPFTDSLKNERSSSTPCGVCAYLLATARLTVEGCTPTSSATSLIIIGFSASGAVVEKFALPRDNGMANAQNGVFSLLDIFHQLNGGGKAFFHIIAHIAIGGVARQQVGGRSGSGEAAACRLHS